MERMDQPRKKNKNGSNSLSDNEKLTGRYDFFWELIPKVKNLGKKFSYVEFGGAIC